MSSDVVDVKLTRERYYPYSSTPPSPSSSSSSTSAGGRPAGTPLEPRGWRTTTMVAKWRYAAAARTDAPKKPQRHNL